MTHDQQINEFDEIDPEKAPLGIEHRVDLKHFLVKVHAAPTCPPWFVDLVRSTVRHFDLETPVYSSELDKDALF